MAAWLAAGAQRYVVPLSGRQDFRMAIEARGAAVTGLCVLKTDSTAGTRGTVTGGFGMHVLDFTLSADRRRVKLLHVLPMMNRWYVRRVVRRDLQFLLGATAGDTVRGGRQVTVEPDSTVVLTNRKYKLKYSLTRVKSYETER